MTRSGAKARPAPNGRRKSPRNSPAGGIACKPPRVRSAELVERKQDSEEELREASAAPEEIAAKREELSDAIDTAEARRRRAADTLAEAETALRAAEQAERDAERAASEAREARARAEARADAARETVAYAAERIIRGSGNHPGRSFWKASVPTPTPCPPRR